MAKRAWSCQFWKRSPSSWVTGSVYCFSAPGKTNNPHVLGFKFFRTHSLYGFYSELTFHKGLNLYFKMIPRVIFEGITKYFHNRMRLKSIHNFNLRTLSFVTMLWRNLSYWCRGSIYNVYWSSILILWIKQWHLFLTSKDNE